MFKLEPFAVQGRAPLGLVLMLATTENMAGDQDIIESVVQPVLAGGPWPDSDAPSYRTANQFSYIHGSRCHLIEMLEDIYIITLPHAAASHGDLCALRTAWPSTDSDVEGLASVLRRVLEVSPFSLGMAHSVTTGGYTMHGRESRAVMSRAARELQLRAVLLRAGRALRTASAGQGPSICNTHP